MARKKKQPREQPGSPSPLRWTFGPDIPTDDFVKGMSLDDPWGCEEAVENFVFMLEKGDFQTWEAVMGAEQGLRLTPKQKELLDRLINFNDEGDDQILYIDEIPRPSEPWYIILNKIVPHLMVEPFRTFDVPEEVQCDGWNDIVAALREHGQGLSLPEGVKSPEEIVPPELRHRLWLQDCFNDLSGLGQEEELTLTDPEQHYRIDEFVHRLRECKASVQFLDLTLDSLLTRVILPEKDRPIFVRMMTEKMGLKTTTDRLAGQL